MRVKALMFRMKMRKILQEASIEEIRITKDEVSRELCRRAKETKIYKAKEQDQL